MARLRDPQGGCPWDLQQNFASIAPYTIEEAYEVADAIERGDMLELKDELGDLLLQVVFHARMAEEAGHFDLTAVEAAICDKMLRRHPHVFGDEFVDDAEQQTAAWETHKARERAARHGPRASALDGVARGLPALLRAEKLQRRAARVGFDWPDIRGVLGKLDEEVQELKAEVAAQSEPHRLLDEIGDLLFSVVNLARHLRVDAEGALRHANAKFERRFRAVEAELRAQGLSPETATLEQMDAAWNRIKQAAECDGRTEA
jgi:ATP diphosphatase